jgi:hypothetical protein
MIGIRTCTCCGLSPPLVAFYDYESERGTQCKKCLSIKHQEQKEARKRGDVQHHIVRLNKMVRRQRFSAAIGIYNRKDVRQCDLRIILKNIKF